MSGQLRAGGRHAWRHFLLRTGLLGMALHALSPANAGAGRGPGAAGIVMMLAAAGLVASVWTGLRPLTATRTPLHIVEAPGTALLSVAFALLLGRMVANAV